MPIEEHALVSEQLNLSVKRSELWKNFVVKRLTKNMRLSAGQDNWSKWLLDVGDGRNLANDDGQEQLWDEIIFSGSLIDEVYGQFLNGDTSLRGPRLDAFLTGRCILAVLNEVTNWYNEAIVQRLPGNDVECCSIDELIRNSATDHHRHSVEELNSVDVPGFPPHRLKLKRNTVVMMLRNLQPSQGLVNGTRLLILDIKRHVLLCRILNGSHAGECRELPRVTLNYEGHEYPFKFSRHQFPVRIAFAMTVNKSQGTPRFHFLPL